MDSSDGLTVLNSAIPPVAVSSLTLLGLTLHEWIYVVTIIYTIIAIIALIKKAFFPTIIIRKDKDGKQKRLRRNPRGYPQGYVKRHARRSKKP